MKHKLYDSKADLCVKLNSFSVALMICSGALLLALQRLSFFNAIASNVYTLVVVTALALAGIIVSRKIYVPLPTLLLMAFVTIGYILTLLFNYNMCSMNVIQFLFYAIVPIYLISQKLHAEYILRYCVYLSLVELPFIHSLFSLQYEWMNQATLGNMYLLLSPVIAAIIHFAYYRRQANFVVIIGYLFNAYVIFLMFLHANRGVIVCLIFCMAVIMLNGFDGEVQKKLTPRRGILIASIVLVVLLVLIFALPILMALQDFFSNTFHTVPSFIIKMIRYIGFGDVSDGRTSIEAYTFDMISRQPLFGYGIETYHSYATINGHDKWPYPHQFIYQYIFEGGILLGLIPCWLSFSLTVKTLFRRIKDKKIFALCCLLVCLSIPKLLMSTDPWDSTAIWMLITYSLIHIFNTYHIRQASPAAIADATA